VTHGVRLISWFQLLTQPVWIVLNILPFIFIAFMDWEKFDLWRAFAGCSGAVSRRSRPLTSPNSVPLQRSSGAMTQIGEQVDFMLPAARASGSAIASACFYGAEWVIVGAKLWRFVPRCWRSRPASRPSVRRAGQMYAIAFGYMIPTRRLLMLMAVFAVAASSRSTS
jgi:hypothetical protein